MATELTTVDISKLDAQTASEVVEAAKSLGFIYVSGHGISSSLLSRVWSLSQALFAMPDSEKEPFAIDSSNFGWSRMHSEKLDPATQRKGDFKEAFNLDVSSGACQPLPNALQADKKILAEFETCCRQVTVRLLDLLALGLGKEPDFFSSKHNASKPSGTVLRLLYYPAIDEHFAQGDVRAGAHTDYGTLTLLFVKAGGSGLEVRPPHSAKDAWQAIPPPAEATADEDCVPILVNVADQLELWTDGLLKSTLHRVMATADKGNRYSIAYFCHPDDDTVLSMKPNETNRAVREEEITAGEHLKRRLAATYEY